MVRRRSYRFSLMLCYFLYRPFIPFCFLSLPPLLCSCIFLLFPFISFSFLFFPFCSSPMQSKTRHAACAWLYMYIYIYIYTHIHIHTHIHTHVYIFIYIYIYTHIYSGTRKWPWEAPVGDPRHFVTSCKRGGGSCWLRYCCLELLDRAFKSSTPKNEPNPWEIWTFKGHFEVSISNWSGIRDPRFEISWIQIMITGRIV